MKRLFLALTVLLAASLLQEPSSSEAANSQLFLSQTCSSTQTGSVSAHFSWQGHDQTAQQRWVDVSTVNNGWLTNTFQGAGPLPGAASSYKWDGLLSSTVYYVRVNQLLTSGSWDPSATFYFTSRDCGSLPSPVAEAMAQLATLEVRSAASMSMYSRAQFGPPWTDVDGNGCDTRNDILQRDLANIVLRAGSDCIVYTGTLLDPYTATTISFVRGVGTSNAVQIDHVVALAAAWRTGAAQQTFQTRLMFANDPSNLLAVDGPTNGAKGDRDAAEWLPPNEEFQCSYVMLQITIKVKYDLWVTPDEQAAMSDVLDDCEPGPASEGHIWYTSAAPNARVYYCELDEGWKSLSAANLRVFSSQEALTAEFPNRVKSAISKC